MKFISQNLKDRINEKLKDELLETTKKNIIYFILTDDNFLDNVAHFIDPKIFPVEYQTIIQKAIDYYNSYKQATIYSKAEIFKDTKELSLVNQILKLKPKNEDFILDTILNIYRMYLIENAVKETQQVREQVIEQPINKNNPAQLLDENKKAINKILVLWNDVLIQTTKHSDLGISVLNPEDFKVSLAELKKEQEQVVPTYYSQLDDLFAGGIFKGEIFNILAPTGVGKTMLLINLAVNLILSNKKFLYITLELSALAIYKRFLQILFSLSNPAIIGFDDMEKYLMQYTELYGDRVGEGRIIYESPSALTPSDIKVLVTKLKLKGFKPDILIIDFADYLSPSQHYAQKRFELEQIYLDLQRVSDEIGMPIITASQVGKAASTKDKVVAEDSFEGYIKSQLSDKILGINNYNPLKKEDFKYNIKPQSQERYRLLNGYISKNRSGKRDVRIYFAQDTMTTRVVELKLPNNELVSSNIELYMKEHFKTKKVDTHVSFLTPDIENNKPHQFNKPIEISNVVGDLN